MTTRTLLTAFVVIMFLIGLPFAFLHLGANPDDAPISPLQHVVAAVANYFGPWGVAIVRIVDFPNAGMRSFRWDYSIGLTLIGALLIALGAQTKNRYLQYALATFWAIYTIVWLVVGFVQIASGLL